MLIQSITVRGFKSYKEEVTIQLTSGVNAVVGPNGAGKSNFMEAIKFALTEEYGKLNLKARQALQNNGSRAISAEPAMVEIVFDNRDRRLPFDVDRVTFRREFGSKKDRLLINGNVVKEVESFLEAAGFTNPYFIVQQGKISVLATASDKDRLNILKDIAGVSLYDRNMNESHKLASENEKEHATLLEKLEAIRERMEELQAQRSKLEKVAAVDKLRRSIEYALNTREINSIRETVQTTRDSLSHIQSEWKRMTDPKKYRIRELEKLQDKNSQEVTAESSVLERLEIRKSTLDAAIERLRYEFAKNSEKLSEYEQKIHFEEGEHHRIEKSISEAEAEKTRLEERLTRLDSSLVQGEEQELRLLYIEANAKLLSFQDRFRRFKECGNIRQWKDSVNVELKKLEEDISKQRRSIESTEETLRTKTSEKSEIASEVEFIQENIAKLNTSIMESESGYAEVKAEIAKLNAKKMNDLDKFAELRQKLTEEKEKEMKLRATMQKIFKPGAMSAYNSMEIVLNNLFSDATGDFGYYGTVISNIIVEEPVRTAVEVAAGPTLMYHIVRDHNVSKTILAEFNRLELPGQVFFFALDKVIAPPNLELFNFGRPTYEPITRLLDHIYMRDDSSVLPVIESIFGRTLLCLNSDIASDARKKYNINCVTPDGDMYHKSGTLKGGYIKSSNSILTIHDQWYESKQEIEKLLQKVDKFEQVQSRVQEQLNTALKQKEKLKARITRQEASNAEAYADIKIAQIKIRTLEENIAREKAHLQKLEIDMKELEARRAGLREELNPTGQSAPTAQQFRDLQTDVKSKFKNHKKILERKLKEDLERRKIEDRLARLEMQRVELLEEKNSLRNDCGEKMDDLAASVETLQEQIDAKLQQWNNLLQEIPVQQKKISNLKKQLAEDAEEEKKLKLEVTADHPDVPALRAKILHLEEQVQNLEKITGSVPEDYAALESKGTRYLRKKLLEANKKLSEYKNVCLDDLALHEQLDGIRKEIDETEKKMDEAKQSIDELTQALTDAKATALADFFCRLQTNFRETFKVLVPQGHAQLVLCGNGFRITDMDQCPELPDFSEDDLIGAEIHVSFSSESASGIMTNMNQLSGGQKSVVAVALILAIQKLDPVPIYLLDEIDAALDPAHRAAVSAVIDDLSSEAQFVCTTFRPEFVQVAKSHYGVIFTNTTSRIQKISLENAMKFVVEDSSFDSGTASDSFSTSANESHLDSTA